MNHHLTIGLNHPFTMAHGIPGKPLFGTLIALLQNGSPVLGVIDQQLAAMQGVEVDAVGDGCSSRLIYVIPG